ncbi:hypothetical protein ACF3NS_08465 [Arsenicicoccus cauae]|uniref:Uncharacterized protein n=1 Tax=Arsenicicoccus cauae TaxID=2663847 RepID=A0A6I3IUB4_9MICO|nr:hypothetical protein [Arsenicicoccus cauae]MTB71861.1 hypothetical protein [Arsenicicoccus cauae]
MTDRTTGKVLAVLICLIVLVPLALLSRAEPVKVGLPALVFVLTGVVVLVMNARKPRR